MLVTALPLAGCVRKGTKSYGTGSLRGPTGTPGVNNAVGNSDSESTPPSDGTLVMVIKDENGLHPSGIRVTVDGPVPGTLISNDKGEIHVVGPEGFYTFAAQVGCYEGKEVFGSGSASGQVVGGKTRNGELSIQWRHGVSPAQPVYPDVTPYWPPGETVTIRFDVIDRCVNGKPRIPDVAFPTYRFEAGPLLRIVEKPVLRSNDKGYGYVKVMCTAEGDPQLAIVDSQNPKDRLDLVGLDFTGGARDRKCRAE